MRIALGKASYRNVTNRGIFMETYCSDRLLSENTNSSQQDRDRALREGGWLAYRKVAQSFYSPEEIPANLSIAPRDYQTKHGDFIREHRNIRDFLAAWFIVDLLENANNNNKDSSYQSITRNNLLEFDFPQVINEYIKDLITSNQHTRNKILNNIEDLLRNLKIPDQGEHWQTVNFICYLLGRIPEQIADKDPATLLKTQLNTVKNNLSLTSRTNRIQAKTQYRTICVSLMRKGDSTIGKEFLVQLLSDRELSSIDRGYHRIYYGDCVALKENIPECYIDREDSQWNNTFETLKKQLQNHIPDLNGKTENQSSGEIGKHENRNEFSLKVQHYITTFLLFIQSRMNCDTTLSPDDRKMRDKQQAFAQRLLKVILNREELLLPEIFHYAQMISIDLSRGDAGRWYFIVELYRLKSEPRRGWLLRNVENGFQQGRVEAVTDHSWMAAVLANFLLPEDLNEIQKYDKHEVIRYLLIDDIAETYTGDFVSKFLNKDTRETAAKRETDALQYLRFKETYKGLFGTRETFDACSDFSKVASRTAQTGNLENPNNSGSVKGSPEASPASGNALVARDLDKLENLIQLKLYREMDSSTFSDDDFIDFEESLTKMGTEYVKHVAEDFILWIENHRGSVILDTRHFYDESLLTDPTQIRNFSQRVTGQRKTANTRRTSD